MKAVVLQEASTLLVKEVPKPELKAGEVLVKIHYAALNHRDQWSRMGMYPGLQYPAILGSDGCGVVESVASEEDQNWLGKTVIINPNINWGDNPEVQSPAYTILGMPSNGTMAEYLKVPVHRLHEKPAHLSNAEAAALPLAGLTAYRALFNKGQVKAGDKVFVTGIGGGVAQFALQFAKAAGATVFVNSGSDDKLENAIEKLGADFGINYKTEKWEKIVQKENPTGFNAIIDGAAGAAFGELVKMLAGGGNMVVYGTTAGNPSPIHIPRLFFSQANIKGSTMGNDQEFTQMIDFVKQHQIKPIVSSIRSIDEAVSAFDEMHEGKQFGKLVLEI